MLHVFYTQTSRFFLEKNLLKLKITVLLLTSLTINLSAIAQIIDQEAYKAERKNKKAARKAYYENMHQAAPGVDWKVLDQSFRLQKSKQKFQLRRKSEDVKVKVANKLTGTWQEIGSKNQAGRIHVAEYDPETNQIYLGSAAGNIWVANKNTLNWEVRNDLMRIPDLKQIRLLNMPNGKKRLIAASGNNNFRILYSDDGGLTWDFSKGFSANSGIGIHVQKMVVANDAKQTIYVLTYEFLNGEYKKNLYMSENHGASFVNLRVFPNTQADIWTDRYGSGTLYMLRGNKLRQYNKAQDQFKQLPNFPGFDPQLPLYLTGRESPQGTYLYAFVRKDRANKTDVYRYKMTDTNWQKKSALSQPPFLYNSVECGIEDPQQLFFGGIECFRSDNGGQNWMKVNGYRDYYMNPGYFLHADICGIRAFKDQQGEAFLLISTDGGTYISRTEARSVENLSLNGLHVSQYYSVYTHRIDPKKIFAGSQDQGFQISKENTQGIRDFQQIISGDYGHIKSSNGGHDIWMTSPFSSYYYDGSSLKNIAHKGSGYLFLPPIMPDPEAATKAYIARKSHLMYLDANRRSSEQLAFDFGEGKLGIDVSALNYSPLNPNYRYVATSRGGFFYSSDKGQTWTKNTTFSGPTGHFLYGSCILASPSQLGRVYLAGSGYANPGVYVSEDHGQNFTPMAQGLPNTLIYKLAATPNEEFIFAATEVGPYVYIREDNYWYDLAGNVAPDQIYWTVDYIPELQIARFGTYGRGIFDFQITSPNLIPSSENAFAESGGEVSLEAEHYHSKAPGINRAWTAYESNQASNRKAMQVLGAGVGTGSTTTGSLMEYKINFKTPGTYKVWIRNAAMDGSGANNSVHVGLNGNCLTCAQGSLGMGKASRNFVWTNTTGGNKQGVNLEINSPGIHSLEIWMREDGVQLDKIYLTQSGQIPTGTGPAESPRGGEGCSICEGDVLLSSQAEVNQFTCSQVTGKLSIQGADIQDLSPLNCLEESNELEISNNPILKNLKGLENFKRCGWKLTLINNAQLEEITSLRNLRNEEASLNIRDNLQLKSLEGLNNFARISDRVSIINNNELEDLQGLSSLSLIIFLDIRKNNRLQNLKGLDAYTEAFQVRINDNPQLHSIQALGNLKNYGEVESGAKLIIENNDKLLSLEGLEDIENVFIFGVSIKNNARLSNGCALYAIRDGFILDSPESSGLNIQNNAPGCNSYNEIIANCAHNTCFQEQNGELVIEAEDYFNKSNNNLGEWLPFASHQASAGQAMQTPDRGKATGNNTSGPKLVYKTNFNTTGTYKVWLRTAALDGSPAHNSLHFGLDGNCFTCKKGDQGIGKSLAHFNWTNTVSKSRRSLTIQINQAGEYDLNIWMREDGVRIDKIYLTKSNQIPKDFGPVLSEKNNCIENKSLIQSSPKQNPSTLILYPNPSSDRLNFQISEAEFIEYIFASDIFGKIYKITNVSANQLDISDLKKGFYQMVIITQERTYTQSFIKE